SRGTTDRIVTRILLNMLCAGSGTPAKYSSTVFGAPLPFDAALRFAGFTFFMRASYKSFPLHTTHQQKTAPRLNRSAAFVNNHSRNSSLARQWPLKYRHPWAPQRIPLRLTMGLRGNQPIRMACVSNVPELPVAIRRRGLRQPCRVTDRAEGDRRRIHVVADRLQALQDGLPLFPIQLPQKRPQSLDEWIFQQRLAIRFRNEEPVQAHIQRFGNLLQRPQAWRHLAALDSRQVRAADLRARLQLALCHPPRLSQLANPLADVLHRLLIRKLRRRHFGRCFLLRCFLRNQVFHPLGQRSYAASAVAGSRPILDQSASLAAYDFPIHLQRVHHGLFFHMCRHRNSSLTCEIFRRADRKERSERSWGEGSYWRDGSFAQLFNCCQEYFSKSSVGISRNRPCLRRFFACPSGRDLLHSSAAGSSSRAPQLYVVLSFPPFPFPTSAHFAVR